MYLALQIMWFITTKAWRRPKVGEIWKYQESDPFEIERLMARILVAYVIKLVYLKFHKRGRNERILPYYKRY